MAFTNLLVCLHLCYWITVRICIDSVSERYWESATQRIPGIHSYLHEYRAYPVVFETVTKNEYI